MVWIVKLGGSLLSADELPNWLDVLARHGAGRVVVVPGGGPFADAVRQAQASWSFDDAIAHRMALYAMLQYGLLLTGLDDTLRAADSEPQIHATLQQRRVPVWLPLPMAMSDPEVEASWRVTSDSLALWLGARLGIARVVLVKSAPLTSAPASVESLVSSGLLDSAFSSYRRRYSGRIYCVGARDWAALAAALTNDAAPARAFEISPIC